MTERWIGALSVVVALAACSPAPTTTSTPATTAAADQSADVTGPDGSGPRAVDRAMADRDFRITISEDKNLGRFNLHLTSLNSERELCVGGAEWPDARGRLEAAADYVSLTANGQGYAMRDAHEECGEACVRRIAPGASLDGFVGYDQFAPEAFDGPGPRTLNFGVEPYFCDSGEVQ